MFEGRYRRRTGLFERVMKGRKKKKGERKKQHSRCKDRKTKGEKQDEGGWAKRIIDR